MEKKSIIQQRPVQIIISIVAFALVGGAVEGLSPSDVTVVDDQGGLLSDPAQSGAEGALSSSQLRYQRAVEEHLTEQGQSMLDRVLGPGRTLVRDDRHHGRLRSDLDLGVDRRVDPEAPTGEGLITLLGGPPQRRVVQ